MLHAVIKKIKKMHHSKSCLRRTFELGNFRLIAFGLITFGLMAAAHAGASSSYSLQNITVINPGITRQGGVDLTVSGKHVAHINTSQSPSTPSPYSGHFVIPGLVDMHVHWPSLPLVGDDNELMAFLYLYHGITTVRSMGDLSPGQSINVRKAIQRGDYPGPEIKTCISLIDGPNALWEGSVIVDNAQQATDAVRQLQTAGADCLKVYDGIQAPVLTALRKAAQQANLPLIGHVPVNIPYDQALLDDMQHLRGLHPLNEKPIERYPLFLQRWQQADKQHLQQVVNTLVKHQLAVTPTLITLDRLLASQQFETLLQQQEYQYLPHYYSHALWSIDKGMNAARFMQDDDFETVKHALQKERQLLAMLHQAGVTIHVGTDAGGAPMVIPGISLHQEMRLLNQAGLSANDVLIAATTTAYQSLGDKHQGQVIEGAPANFIILKEDPSDNLNALNSIVAVVKDGQLYPREWLDQQLNEWTAYNNRWVERRLITPLFGFAVDRAIQQKINEAALSEAPH